MAKLILNKGFTIIELCVVMFGISILVALFLPNIQFYNSDYYEFVDAYLYKQSLAMVTSTYQEYDSKIGETVIFNHKGNVTSAKTISFPKRKEKIIIELGSGRLVFK